MRFLILAAFAALSVAAPVRSDHAGAVVAIKAGPMVDVLAGKVRQNQIILIEGDRITAVGPKGAPPRPRPGPARRHRGNRAPARAEGETKPPHAGGDRLKSRSQGARNADIISSPSRGKHHMSDITNPVARRAFVTSLGVSAIGAGLASCATAKGKGKPAAAAPAAPARWEPAPEAQDGWMELPGRHRFVFDSISTKGAGEALFFANNYLTFSKSGYGLEPTENAVIIIMRHLATPFACNDEMWAKYGPVWGELLKHKDPKTKKIALRNTLMTVPPDTPADEAVSIPIMVDKGVHFAVCGAATHFIAGVLAKKMKAEADGIYADLAANLVANAHMVPAGIIAVNRAQERGYAFSYIG
jgi:intracellular sulfur oxidation DsrE/DsrF family protein